MYDPPNDRLDADIKEMLDAFEGPPRPRPRPSKARRRFPRALAALTAGSAVIAGAVLGAWALGGDEGRRAALGPGAACGELRIQGRRYVARKVSPALLVRSRPLAREAVAVCGESTTREAHLLGLRNVDPKVAVARRAVPDVVYVATQSRCARARGGVDLARCLAGPGR